MSMNRFSSDQNNEVEGVQGALKGVNSVASIWCDLVEPTTAEVLAEYRSLFLRKNGGYYEK